MSTQEGGGGFKLVASTLLSVVLTDWATSCGLLKFNINLSKFIDNFGSYITFGRPDSNSS
jgi:hypothetical protein